MNFAPCKYVVSSCCVPSSPLVTDVTFFIFDISKSYVGIFSSSIFILITGIFSSSVIVVAFVSPSVMFAVYVPSLFVIVNFIGLAK